MYVIQPDTTLYFHSSIIRGASFRNTCSVKVKVSIKIVRFPLRVFVLMYVSLTSIYDFQVRHPSGVEYNII